MNSLQNKHIQVFLFFFSISKKHCAIKIRIYTIMEYKLYEEKEKRYSKVS